METNNFQSSSQIRKEGSVGPIIGSVIIILLIIMGGLYFLGSVIKKQQAEAEYRKQNSAQDISVIEKDLNETNIDALDDDLMSIEAELDAAI